MADEVDDVVPDVSRAPAFQFYPKDFLADSRVARMRLPELGAYITLLCYCWTDGSIPADPDALARLCRVSLSSFARLWPALEPCFQNSTGTVPERLIQPRIERERAKQNTYRLIKALAGQKGGRAKAEHKQTPSKVPSKRLAKASPPSSSSSSSSEVRTTVPPSNGGTTEGEDAGKDEKPQIGAFIRRFCELYSEHRHGAKYFVSAAKHVPRLRALLRIYDPARLEKMAGILLTTDDEWIDGTDRGIGILSTKASWLDERLSSWEAAHGPIQVTP